MFIRFQIAPTGKKHGWAQGGPDCWYYSAKTLLRFYGLANSKSDKMWAYLQKAKLIRLFINGMREIHGKDLHHPLLTSLNLRKWIESEIENIEKTRADVVLLAQHDAATQSDVQALLQSENLWEKDNVMKLSLVSRTLDGLLAGKDLMRISAARYTFLKIGRLVAAYQEDEKIWSIGEIFASAFPSDLFQAVKLPEMSSMGLYEALKAHGPLWTTGSLHAKDKSAYSISTFHDGEETKDSRVLVESYISGSSHAVAVYGISTDSNMVEYADPHDFTTPRRVQAHLFFSHLRTFEFGSGGAGFLKVSTPGAEDVLKRRAIHTW